jgi:hypothetical protein
LRTPDAAIAAWQAIAAGAKGAELAPLYHALMRRYVARLGPAETAYIDRLASAPMNFQAARSSTRAPS